MSSEISISGELASELGEVAHKAAVAPEELLHKIVRQFVSRYNILHPNGEERRTFLRLSVNIPAMIYMEAKGGEVRYQAAVIEDVSPTGLKIVCTGKKACKGDGDEGRAGIRFEIIFAYKDDMEPIRFWCEAKRVERIDGMLHVGAMILKASGDGQISYQKLLDDLGLAEVGS